MFKTFFKRMWAVLVKEFIQMKRDRGTFALIIGIPIMEVILFGFTIDSNPKYLPTAIVSGDQGVFSRALIKGLENTDYFRVKAIVRNEQESDYMLATNQVQFVLHIPPGFERDLIRGKKPDVLLEGDASDPGATGYAITAANSLLTTVFNKELDGPLSYIKPAPVNAPVNLITHAKFNPELVTQYNIVPGLMGVIITLTMTMITCIAITREQERGTMENLLSTPLRPLEIMLGKILPYILVGYMQATLILVAAIVVFKTPTIGNIAILFICMAPFIAANLAVGIMISTVAINQLQAVQMTVFFFLPSFLLSGFLFPFHAMPEWAQFIGNIIPLTHFLRIIRGVLLKGNDWTIIWTDLWPILLFLVVMIMLGINRFRRTLD